MEDYYRAAVAKAAADNLKFPSKCAYCLKLTPLHHITVKHNKLKGYELKVPYCETHSQMIRYMKLVQYGAIASTILFAVLLGRYLHNHEVFVAGFLGFNYLVAGFISLVVFAVVFVVLRTMVVRRYFAGQGSLDQGGAVEIVGVYPDIVVLHFHNRTYGTEFSQLNQGRLIEI